LRVTGTQSATRSPSRLTWALLALLLLASSALVLWVGRDTLFRGDDWDLLLYRGGFNAEVFLAPHNEHLSALLIAAYKAIPALVGPHYTAFRLALLALDLAVAVLFFVFARERVGDWPALLATSPLLLMGAGSDNLLWPTQIGVVGSLACGLGVLILLDRPGTAAKAGACAALTASIWFSSDGLFFLVCAGIWLLLSRERWREAWIVAIPAITYVAWYSGYGSSEFTTANLRAAPGFMLDSAAAGVSALTGIGSQTGHPRAIGGAVGLLALAALATFAVKARPKPTPRLAAIVALPIVSWTIIALGRADGGDPYATRYVYASALFVLMAALETLRGEYLPRLFRGWKLVGLALAIGFSLLFSTKLLIQEGDYWRSVSQYIHGRTAAIELTRRTVDPNLVLEPLPDMAHMTAGWYLNAVEKYGESPTGGVDIAALGEQGRSAADQVLAAAAPARFVASPRGSGPIGSPLHVDPGFPKVASRGSCLFGRPHTPLSVLVPPGGILLRPAGGAFVNVRLRRYASTYDEVPEQSVTYYALLAIATDHSRVPWHARISSASPVHVCGASAPRRLRRGPLRPPSGDQHCLPMSLGEDECRFSRY
jgi:hypothetical protein